MKKTGKLLVALLVIIAMAATLMMGCQNEATNPGTEAPQNNGPAANYPLNVTDDVVAGGTFTGTYVDALKNGEGKITYDNGNVYEGPVVAGVAVGYGKLTYKIGDVYEGLVVNGLPEGACGTLMIGANTYVGGFSGGKMKGEGVFTWKDGHVFTGVFEGVGEDYGELTADGFLAYNTGLSFDGTLVAGEPTKGTFYWPGNLPAWKGNFTAFLTGYGDLDMGNGIFYRGPMFAGVLTNCDEWLATGEKVVIQYPVNDVYVGEKFEGEFIVDEETLKDILIGTMTYPDGTVIENVTIKLDFSFAYNVPTN